jgi:hypothetical protein
MVAISSHKSHLANSYLSTGQIARMANFFGVKGMELKKVKKMATREEVARLEAPAFQTNPLTINKS